MLPCTTRLEISIHPPREGWDPSAYDPALCKWISIHPPREGWDKPVSFAQAVRWVFQSTHPVRGGTRYFLLWTRHGRISIHPPREGWDRDTYGYMCSFLHISIHPPREGWDSVIRSGYLRRTDFNPPTP